MNRYCGASGTWQNVAVTHEFAVPKGNLKYVGEF